MSLQKLKQIEKKQFLPKTTNSNRNERISERTEQKLIEMNRTRRISGSFLYIQVQDEGRSVSIKKNENMKTNEPTC